MKDYGDNDAPGALTLCLRRGPTEPCVSDPVAVPLRAVRRVLRYGSATLYNDGNPLAVIDSEMPNIERRLGLWKPGAPLPTPSPGGDDKPCLHPKLKHTELWRE